MAANGFLKGGIQAVLADDSSAIASTPAIQVRRNADALKKWCQVTENVTEADVFEEKLIKSFDCCFTYTGRSYKKTRGMWTSYHNLRTSECYRSLWYDFLLSKVGVDEVYVIFYQYIGDFVLKELAKVHFAITDTEESSESHSTLTYEESNALHYAAGYVPRSLNKKLKKSAHPYKKDLILLLPNLLDDGEEFEDDSSDWIKLIDRGGLTKVNNDTYQLFLAVEVELRKHLTVQQPTLFKDMKQTILQNDNVQFVWSIVCIECNEEVGKILLEMIIEEWIKIRGFSYASAWVEKYKQDSKKTTEKSKGLRKQLLPGKSD